jgi:hypothetical protein
MLTKADRQRMSAEALERQREEARNAPPPLDRHKEAWEVLFELTEILTDMFPTDPRLVKCRERMSEVLFCI